ncbi:MAG: hypothetical protein R2751_11560 [Bacteroidales bacterium]
MACTSRTEPPARASTAVPTVEEAAGKRCPDGRPARQQLFLQPEGDLEQIIWYRNNRSSLRARYHRTRGGVVLINVRDTLHGAWEGVRSRNGQLRERQVYEMGEPAGVWKAWDRMGGFRMEIDFSGATVVAGSTGTKGRTVW